MFGSISIAPPNSIVTSSFTATSACTIGIMEAEAVRVNGQLTPDRTLTLVRNDVVELDVMSGPAFDHRFIEWSFDGNPCYFAIASGSGTNRPTLRSQYRNKTWIDYAAPTEHLLTAMTANGNQSNITKTYAEATTLTVDTACFFESSGNYSYFCRSDVNSISRRIDHASKPISQTRIWNNSNQTWESYILCADGYIDKISYLGAKTRSTLRIPDAKCIFSDGVTLYVGGLNKVVVLSDFNNAARVVVVDGTITNGVALADIALISTTDGHLMKLTNSTTSEIITGSMVGTMTTFKGQFIVPLTEQYKINIYDNHGVLVNHIDTGDYLPFAALAGRNTMAVSSMDSRDVMVFTDTITAPVIKSFNTKVAFAVPVGDGFVASHYLSTYDTTIPPNPVVTGLNWPRWLAPVGAFTGTGEYKITTIGEDLKVTGAPNAGLLVNSATGTHLAKDQTSIALFTQAYLGSVSTAVAVGNYAFDFKVDAQESDSFTTTVNVPPQLYSNKIVYNFTVPEKAIDAPIALSHGTLKVNGTDYNGRTPLNAGDTIQVTINVPQTRASYYSVLSLADSQFPLVISSAVNTVLDSKRFVDYGAKGLESTIKIKETGTFYFPDYYDAKVFKGEEELSFPTTLRLDDELKVIHIRASQWWLDPRDTVIMGPTINHIVRNSTAVDDVPDEVDFGIVEIGIPDFEFPAPLEPSISGLSDGYEAEIFSEYMSFSINGGAWVARPKVKNGDKVRVLYRVKNLFETMWAKTLLADGVTNYEWGFLNINPALGEWVPARDNIDFLDTNWLFTWNHYGLVPYSKGRYVSPNIGRPDAPKLSRVQNHVSKAAARSALLASTKPMQTPASRPLSIAGTSYKLFSSSTGRYLGPSYASKAISPKRSAPSYRFKTLTTSGVMSTIERGSEPSKYFFQRANQFWANQSAPSYNDDSDVTHRIDIRHGLEAAFGRSATYTIFKPLFQHETIINPTVIPQYFSYQNNMAEQIADVIWSVENGPIVLSHDMEFSKTHYTSASAVTFWSGVNDFVREVEFIGTAPVNYNMPMRRLNPNNGYFPLSMPMASLVSFEAKPALHTKFIRPMFAASTAYQKVINPVFDTQAPRISATMEFASILYSQAENTMSSTFDSELYVANNDNMGGYATEEEALLAAEEYNFGVPVMAYRQPEGTFSFVFQRPTALFCPIKGTNIYATKWLIGGG